MLDIDDVQCFQQRCPTDEDSSGSGYGSQHSATADGGPDRNGKQDRSYHKDQFNSHDLMVALPV